MMHACNMRGILKIGLPAFVFTLTVFIITAYYANKTTRSYREIWKLTEATIMDAPIMNKPPPLFVYNTTTAPSLMKPYNELDKYYNYNVSYTYNNIAYTNKILLKSGLNIGDKISLYVLDNNPTSISQDPGTTTMMDVVFMWIFASSAGFLVWIALYRIVFRPGDLCYIVSVFD